ncbi:hypothetical protein M4I21_13975 [Cellulophaga sp. 20_2_10]|uniref:hypothetical protein n=1 Tax=Cellulophaga sp. 20_2_10 TaxID=2942476 RepID=UPI00201AF5EE|nr:hypothetical protein [Cellulophaga sp. 20_2_10]MCL5246926.1 hypothetical protein [Cellulophaga sp. 20_2_10]
MNRYEKFLVIIDTEKAEYESKPEFKEVSSFLKPNEWGDNVETYQMEIFYYPTYNLLNNQFSFGENISEKDDNKIPYEQYLSESEIKSLSFYDYAGDKLYRFAIQKEEMLDWDCINPENLLLITSNLLEYLKQNNLTDYHNETIEELEKLNKLSKFCKSINSEIILFNPDM